jgi:tRNA-(ms[2]io[6]A)-hydroxylase
MKLLAEGLEDPGLSQLYAGLLASEARHHQTYIDLAVLDASETVVYARLDQLAIHEASVLAVPGDEIRLHS